MELKELIEQENLHLNKLNDLIKKSIDEEQMISSKLIEIEDDYYLSFGQKIADKVAEFGGSWTFIISFFMVLFTWIIINIFILKNSFDPYPFILLNLVLSCIAAIQAPIIMMSQNRREDKDRRRARGDYMINLKAEMEVRSLHAKIDLLLTEQMQSLFKIQNAQLDLLNKINNALDTKVDK